MSFWSLKDGLAAELSKETYKWGLILQNKYTLTKNAVTLWEGILLILSYFCQSVWFLLSFKASNLEPPWGHCSTKELDYYVDYTVSACKVECETKDLVDRCGCRDAYMPYNKSSSKFDYCHIYEVKIFSWKCLKILGTFIYITIYCDVPGSPCLSKKGESNVRFVSF